MTSPTLQYMPPTARGAIKTSSEYISGRVLDLGAGSAKYKPDIMRTADSYTAFDGQAGTHINHVGDVDNLSCFEENMFDTVICTEVLEHVQKPWKVIEEIQRVLAPGGYCVLTTPFLLPFHADPCDFYRYTTAGDSHLFARTGMEVVKTAKSGNLAVIIGKGIKFAFCNPYKHKHPGFLRRNTFRIVYKFLCAFGTKTTEESIFWAGTYIVARKPL